MSKVAVIGVGNLGSCIAYEIASRGLVDELLLVDVIRELAEGNAADIEQAMAFRNETRLTAGDYGDLDGSQVIVVAAGKPRSPEMKSRMELLQVNWRIIDSVSLSLRKVEGEPIIVTLTNPVDTMNYLMWRNTGLDRKRVLGSAGMLDSARLRTVLSRRYQTPVQDVEAYVIGEHGDNQTLVFSQARVEGEKTVFARKEREEIAEELRQSALEVISKKGATIFAPASNTANMIEAILRDKRRTAVCSVVLDGEYRLKDVSIGVPVTLGKNGVERVLEWELDEDEKRSFYEGAEQLKGTIKEYLQR